MTEKEAFLDVILNLNLKNQKFITERIYDALATPGGVKISRLEWVVRMLWGYFYKISRKEIYKIHSSNSFAIAGLDDLPRNLDYSFKEGAETLILEQICKNHNYLGTDHLQFSYYIGFLEDLLILIKKDNLKILGIYFFTENHSSVEEDKAITLFLNTYFNAEERSVKEDYSIDLVVSTVEGLSLRGYSVDFRNTITLEKHYNPDIFEFHDKLLETIKERDHSFNIIHGIPGCGKTSYLEYLSSIIVKDLKKKVIFIPPNMLHALTDPSFFPFITQYPNSVIIVEDAEEILVKSEQRSAAVSNILNITDGMLSKIFKLHFLFTFNTQLSKIDPALLRKGRLTSKYEFKELEYNKAEILCSELGIPVPENRTLAEIYNTEDTTIGGVSSKAVGFLR